MQVIQYKFVPGAGWQTVSEPAGSSFSPQLLLAFGSGRDCSGDILLEWRNRVYPGVAVIGCSTAGEIIDTAISENTMVVTAIQFDSTATRLQGIRFPAGQDSTELGKELAAAFDPDGLRLLFVLADGIYVNGSRLVEALRASLPADVIVTGALAGDGKRFEATQVIFNEAFGERCIAAVGFYGDDLEVGVGSFGGWDPFGPDRLITRAEENVLYELDGRNALALYREYLGEYADELPSSGLLFPLSLRDEAGHEVVRTLLAIDEDGQSMTFAGDVPEGSYARLMRANFERLIEGAYGAAERTRSRIQSDPELALLISCVGRRLVLQQRAEEELDEVRDVLGDRPAMSGFYSYGEIGPLANGDGCTLHNQTMTIVTLSERAGATAGTGTTLSGSGDQA